MVYQKMGCLQVDQATYDSAKVTGMEFEILEPIKVKGKDGKQAVFRPTNDVRDQRGTEAERAVGEGRKKMASSPGAGAADEGAGGGSSDNGNGTSSDNGSGNGSSGGGGVARRHRKSMWTSGRRDSFDTGATLLSQGMMRTKERTELFEIMDSLFLDGGGMLVGGSECDSGDS